ncbi:MAG: hypothetical protein D6744_01380, partial [Planctomycetota bacterium]
RASFGGLVLPGETLTYEAEIEQLTDSAASTVGRVRVGDEPIGEVDIVFSHIDQNMSGLDFPEENFVFTESFMSLLRAFTSGDAQRVAL